MSAAKKTVKELGVNVLVNNLHMIGYPGAKGSIVSFMRSLSKSPVEKRCRVNAVAGGPIGPPLIPSTCSKDHVESFPQSAPLNRAGQPDECEPSYVFLASAHASCMTEKVLHPSDDEVVHGWKSFFGTRRAIERLLFGEEGMK